MAHGDYHCCALCDCKITYGGFDATTKEQICSECVADLAQKGVIVHNVQELLEWIEKTDIKILKSILKDIGFTFCFYPNVIDRALIEKGIIKNKERRIR